MLNEFNDLCVPINKKKFFTIKISNKKKLIHYS